MKRFLFLLSLLAIASTVYAATLPSDANNVPIQAPAFNGALTTALVNTGAGNAVNVDMRQNIAYSVYCAAVSKERSMFANYTKSSRNAFLQSPIPATTWHTQYVSKTTPFVNISGCAGWLRKH